jgi:RNA polymerase sigma factor (TIGR02999 family)
VGRRPPALTRSVSVVFARLTPPLFTRQLLLVLVLDPVVSEFAIRHSSFAHRPSAGTYGSQIQIPNPINHLSAIASAGINRPTINSGHIRSRSLATGHLATGYSRPEWHQFERTRPQAPALLRLTILVLPFHHQSSYKCPTLQVVDETREQVTRLLSGLKPDGSASSADLLPLVYGELRRLAALRMANEPAGQTLQATALVHEAWLRLVSAEHQTWQNRGHFFGAAAEAMRRILVENARRKKQLKRGGDWQRINWDGLDVAGMEPDDCVLAVDEALQELAKVNRVEAEVVKLRFFGGLEHKEISTLLHVSERTVHRYWDFAKVWLYRQLRRSSGR